MSTISRRKPNSNETRWSAIQVAQQKETTVPPAQNVLTASTIARLAAIFTAYGAAMTNVGTKLATQTASTQLTETAFALSRMFISHFIQVFFLGVERGVYATEQKAFYGLDVNQTALPRLVTVAEVIMWGERLKTGDPLRVAAGGAAMSNPTIAQCNTAYDDFILKNSQLSTDKEAYDTALEALDALNTEADGVILKVWDEAETFYNEETPSSKRNNCRLWGVVYVSQGPPATVTAEVLDIATALPVPDATVKIEGVDNERTTDAAGIAQLTTSVVGDEVIIAEAPGYMPMTLPLTIEEGGTYTMQFKLTHV